MAFTEAQIEAFCDHPVPVPSEIDLIAGCILIIAEGDDGSGKIVAEKGSAASPTWSHFKSCFSDPDWRKKFLEIDAEGHGRYSH